MWIIPIGFAVALGLAALLGSRKPRRRAAGAGTGPLTDEERRFYYRTRSEAIANSGQSALIDDSMAEMRRLGMEGTAEYLRLAAAAAALNPLVDPYA